MVVESQKEPVAVAVVVLLMGITAQAIKVALVALVLVHQLLGAL